MNPYLQQYAPESLDLNEQNTQAKIQNINDQLSNQRNAAQQMQQNMTPPSMGGNVSQFNPMAMASMLRNKPTTNTNYLTSGYTSPSINGLDFSNINSQYGLNPNAGNFGIKP